VSDQQVLGICAHLLGVDAALLEKSLCQRKMSMGFGARREVIYKPQTKANAEFTRDTLAKALYSKLFDWLVKKVNDAIATTDDSGTLIGVLDIYGFEIFDFNSFEQLCINFVNEKLQQIFIQLTLKAEQDEYLQEGIPWKEIKYYNNKPLCDVIVSSIAHVASVSHFLPCLCDQILTLYILWLILCLRFFSAGE
jgi:myosin-1